MKTIVDLGIDELMPDPSQPRKSFLTEELYRLATSIGARGMLMPIRVAFDEARQVFRIVTGESRWRAARIAGLKTVPCIVLEEGLSETELLSDQIIENHLRQDLRPLELSRALSRLKLLRGCNSQTLALELGLSGASISRAEALLTLPGDIQSLVDSGKVSESAAYELSRLPDEALQRELAAEIASGKLNRDQTAETVRNRLGNKPRPTKPGRLTAKLADAGLSFVISAAGRQVTADDVRKVIDQLRRLEKKLYDGPAQAVASPL